MKSILIVDDEYDFSRALNVILSLEGYKTRAAFDGLAAMQSVSEQTPDLILLDIMLPLLSGVDVLQSLASNPATRSVPVILMSGALPNLPKEFKALPFLQKPFDFLKLTTTVRSVLGQA